MKILKKTLALALLVIAMTFCIEMNVIAAQVNTTETVEWGKAYSTVAKGVDYYYLYSMNLSQSGKVTITMNAETCGLFSYIEIYDISNQTVWESYIGNGMNTYAIELLAGEYTIKVNDTGTSWIPKFFASGETVTESYMDKNNQLGTASSYSIGKNVKAHLAQNDNTDIYQLSVNKTGYLTMKFTSTLTEFDMELVSDDGDISYTEACIPLGTSSYKYFVKKGTYYISFKQRGTYDNKYSGTYSFSSKLTGLTTTKIKSVKNLKGKKAKITWTKKADVDGYQVQIALNNKFKKGKKTKNIQVTTTSHSKAYTFTKLKKGKTYYARIRTYKLAGGYKHYSSWSSVKKFKVKK